MDKIFFFANLQNKVLLLQKEQKKNWVTTKLVYYSGEESDTGHWFGGCDKNQA